MGTIRQYMNYAGQYKLLSFKEEKQLAKTIKEFKTGKQKQAAREELINCNLKLVVKIAFQYKRYSNLTIMEIINTGNIGLIKAVDKYNPRKFKTRFSTYATYHIRHEILKIIYTFGTSIYIPSHLLIQLNRYKQIVDTKKDITNRQIRSLLKISQKGLSKIKMAKTKTISLDKSIPKQNYDGYSSLHEIIYDTKHILPDEVAMDRDTKKFIFNTINKLKPMDKEIIIDMFYNKETLRQVGKKHKVTPEYIRQRKKIALNKLRRKLSKQILFKEM